VAWWAWAEKAELSNCSIAQASQLLFFSKTVRERRQFLARSVLPFPIRFIIPLIYLIHGRKTSSSVLESPCF
jgi:hypothetical protein